MENSKSYLILKNLELKFNTMVSHRSVFKYYDSFSIIITNKGKNLKIRFYKDELIGDYSVNSNKVAKQLRSYLMWKYPNDCHDINIEVV